MMVARRLLLVALTVVAPMIAACGTLPTGNDDPSPPPPADSTGRKDQQPWN